VSFVRRSKHRQSGNRSMVDSLVGSLVGSLDSSSGFWLEQPVQGSHGTPPAME
jgi:hypothetical protein